MTIDETIAKYNKLANNDRTCYPEEAQQLAEWLEQLKDYQDKNKMVVRIDVENMDSIKDKIEELSKYAERQYNKALDDLLEDANEMAIEVDVDTYTMKAIGIGLLENIAEQLKAGGKNERSI